MASELETARDKLIEILIARATSGTRAYTVGNRSVSKDPLPDIVDALLKIQGAVPSGQTTTNFVEVEDHI